MINLTCLCLAEKGSIKHPSPAAQCVPSSLSFERKLTLKTIV